MSHPTHSFETPCAREGWAIGLEYLFEAHPDGRLHAFTTRPVILPNNPKAIQEELARLNEIHRHAYRGKPAEL